MTPNVIIPYNEKRTTQFDLLQIKQELATLNPAIRFIPYDETCTPVILAHPFSTQTVTCTLDNHLCPPIFEYIPGPKYFPRPRAKKQLFTELQQAAHPVPYSKEFAPDHQPDLARFGPLMTIKTTLPWTARATGIYTFRTNQFHNLKTAFTKIFADEIAQGFPPLLQDYIYTGAKPTHTRVTTFLNAPIVCFTSTAPKTFNTDSLQGIAGGEATSNASSNRARALCNDSEIIELAVRISHSFPDAAVLSIDIVRCLKTQKLYCLEVNLGNLCVLSAPICKQLRNELGPKDVHKQFNAYKTIADRINMALGEL